ncbi:CynX/NimT family MFS transporter [uncultured Nitratireductor sp.]|uniref:MFS transporter n=1 Tax=uncultured Nitratireductor sp. TaxID=520953 RepID=UPI0025F081DD|nr:MFS transporter [uncultured Nitratireductor sp.]
MTGLTDTDERDVGTSSPSERAATGLALVALFVVALNLRPAIAAVSPLIEMIRSDLGLSATGAALLTSIPVVAMALFAPVAASVARRLNLHASVLLGLVMIGIGSLARAGGQITWLQTISIAVVGAGIGIAQTLLPAVIKTRFANRATLVTGIYTAGLGLGAVVAAGASVPLSDWLKSWPLALASWAVLAGVGIVLWVGSSRPLNLAHRDGPGGPVTRGLPWRSAAAWNITAISAGNSALYYCELAWIAPLLQNDAGLSATRADMLLTAMLIIQVVAMLGVPALLGNSRHQRRTGLMITALMVAIGFFGFAFVPDTGTWVWLILIGVGHGGLFPLALSLPAAESRDPDHASQLSGMAFLIGYACAGVAPLVIGALRDAQGTFQLGFALLGVVTVLMLGPIRRL